jgi:hypothetical protein
MRYHPAQAVTQEWSRAQFAKVWENPWDVSFSEAIAFLIDAVLVITRNSSR